MALIGMDLQRDFLDSENGRLPIPNEHGNRVLATANRAFQVAGHGGVPVVLVTSHFPASDRIGNVLRHAAALANSPGAQLDPRVVVPAKAFEFHKATADAFSNHAFVDWLRETRVRDLVILGVFAEGCVRATVASALRRGFTAHVLVPGVASDASWKTRWALRLMRLRGARLVDERWFVEAMAASSH